jgi:predicted O-methyltransferase YrrM
VTCRCAYCPAPLDQARQAFAEHDCDRPRPTMAQWAMTNPRAAPPDTKAMSLSSRTLAKFALPGVALQLRRRAGATSVRSPLGSDVTVAPGRNVFRLIGRGDAPGATPRRISTALTVAELDRLSNLATDRVVVEVGSRFGASTVALASTAAHVHAIDPHWPEQRPDGKTKTSIAKLMLNLHERGLLGKVTIHVGLSQDVLPLFQEDVFDLAFIDALHDRESVARDLALVLRVLRLGGVVAFHDYGLAGTRDRRRGGKWAPFGVTEVVDGFVSEPGHRLEVIDSLAVVYR